METCRSLTSVTEQYACQTNNSRFNRVYAVTWIDYLVLLVTSVNKCYMLVILFLPRYVNHISDQQYLSYQHLFKATLKKNKTRQN